MLLETIKIDEGKVFNLAYHQMRCDKSRKELLSSHSSLSLDSHIKPPAHGLWRCRITYADKIQSVEYLPYHPKSVRKLKIVPSNLEYAHKYANRTTLNTLLSSHPNIDDILIEKNGLLCDASIANIAFYDGEKWFTPTSPLLKGTTRQRLLDEGTIDEKEIHSSDIGQYTQVALMNSMIGFKVLKELQIEDSKGNIYDY